MLSQARTAPTTTHIPNTRQFREMEAEALAQRAHRRLIAQLWAYYNDPNKNQRDALLTILRYFSRLAFGLITGRYAAGLPTGAGKTESAVAWITELVLSGYRDISVIVCSNTVDALCEIKRKLIANGVPTGSIALWHGYRFDKERAKRGDRGFATEEATAIADLDTRQIMLCTHARLRGKHTNPDKLNTFWGRPRDLTIYDESLLVAECLSLRVNRLRRDIHNFEDDDRPEQYAELLAYLKPCLAMIEHEAAEQKAKGREPTALHMPDLAPGEMGKLKAALPKKHSVLGTTTEAFLDMVHLPLRFHHAEAGGVITYDIAVPESLDRVVILDASFPIRTICRHPSITEINEIKAAGVVSYEFVRIYQLFLDAGRHSLRLAYDRKKHPEIFKEVAEVAKCIPKDEAVLFVTFTPEGDTGRDYQKAIKEALEKAGVDPEETTVINGTTRKRFNITTWGRHTSVNTFSFCSNVIFCGVLFLGELAIRSHLAGQQGDLLTDPKQETVNEAERGEVAHALYQAMNRGTSRVVLNGKAKPMNVWLIHRHKNIRPLINSVMPGVRWDTWEPKFIKQPVGKVASIARQINRFLNTTDLDKISVQSLKKTLNISAHKNTFTMALDQALMDNPEWTKERYTLVRSTSPF